MLPERAEWFDREINKHRFEQKSKYDIIQEKNLENAYVKKGEDKYEQN